METEEEWVNGEGVREREERREGKLWSVCKIKGKKNVNLKKKKKKKNLPNRVCGFRVKNSPGLSGQNLKYTHV